MERYRPGALHNGERNQHPERNIHERDHDHGGVFNDGDNFPSHYDPPRPGRWNRGRGRGVYGDHRSRGHGSRGRGGRGGGRDHEELSGLMDDMNLRDNDLRHRLNQRNQEPVDRSQHSRLQGRGNGGRAGRQLPRPKKNTENFNPCHEPTDMRLLVAQPSLKKFNQEVTSRDVVIVTDLFGSPDDQTLYNELLEELKHVDMDGDRLWQKWHGDSHVIADDKKRWKQDCPTFGKVIEKIKGFFDMDVKATRLNWYRDSSEWKPFHHDAAAVKPDKAKTQNFTVAVSFGMTRDAAFEHATTKTKISMPQPNGTIYAFGKDVNIIWRHGILQLPPDQFEEQGRLSIIAWGWIEQKDV